MGTSLRGLGSPLFATRRAAEAAPGRRRTGQRESPRACPGSPGAPRRNTIRQTPWKTKAGGWAHGPRPPPQGGSATRLAGSRQTGGIDTRGGRAPSPLSSCAEAGGARESAGRAGLSPSGTPGPSSRPRERLRCLVPWSRASATPLTSRGTHSLHRPAACPSTIPAARGVRAAPPSSCGLGLPSAEGGGGGGGAVPAH